MKKEKVMKKILITTAALLLPLAVLADDMDKKYSIQLNLGGGYGFNSNDDYKDVGNSGLFGVEAGANINDNFRLGVEFDYLPSFAASRDPSQQNFSYLVQPGTTTINNGDVVTNANASASTVNVSVHPDARTVISYVGMLNLYYDLNKFDNFKPYLTVGLGMSRNKTKHANAQVSADLPSGVTMTGQSTQAKGVNGASKNNFAWKLGFGTRYDVNNSLAFDFRYQFQYLGKFKTAVVPDSNNAYAQGTLMVSEILVGIVHKF
jgi:opacity protein-like surface antigen